jgi:enoyl-CoA hydratase/carnithine racemase
VGEVVADPAALMPRALELAKLVASHAPLTLQATKEALLRLRPAMPVGSGEDLILMCYMSQDFREGMDAFLSKRAPRWQGL